MHGILGLFNFQENSPATSHFEEMLNQFKTIESNQLVYQSNNGILSLNHQYGQKSSVSISQYFSLENKYYLVFNGSIYNIKQLQEELNLTADNKKEFLLKLLIHKGKDALKMLDGSFVLAFYNKEKEELLLARDRLGIKPLYWQLKNGNILFSSEINMLEALNKRNINLNALHSYLRFNFIPSTTSILQNTQQLQPGQILQFSKDGLRKENYYNLPEDYNNQTSNKKELQDELFELISKSVQNKMKSDEPIGCFLSGGLDSSIICAIAAQEKKNLPTYTIGFKGNEFYDESKYAELVAKKYKTEHSCINVTEDDMLEEVEFLLNNLSEPFADSSLIALSILCRHASKDIRIALSGDGADELFAGYNRYRAALMMEKKNSTYKSIRLLYPILKHFNANEGTNIGNKIRQVQKFGRIAKLDFKERYIALCERMDTQSAAALLKNFEYTSQDKTIIPFLNKEKGLQSYLLNDMHFILPGDMLPKVNHASNPYDIEVKPIFLDEKIVEFAMNLPLKYKINSKKSKILLRDTFSHLLPNEILTQPKHGFEVPLEKWFCGALKNTIENYLSKEFIMSQNIFNFDKIKQIKEKFYSTKSKDLAASVWAILVFNKWWEREIKK